ncbi:MAG: zinc ribbon domain-containing protein [Myxococcaceae bacterium]
MQERLKALADLQKVDLEIVALRKSAEVYPRQMGELERELSLAKGEVEAERTKLLDVERQRRTLEQNIVEEKDKVRKWETRLSEQRSTREYAALAREIDIAKKANGTMAEELLELGKMQAQLRELLKGKEQQYAVRVGDVGGKLNELRARVAGFEGQVKELEGKRADVAKAVHPPLLSRYETVRKRRTPALVTVIAGTCQGCNMSVPPQLYNNLKTSLQTDICPSCHRIICAPEAIEPPPAKKG